MSRPVSRGRYDCDVCQKSYARQSILKQHKKVAHGTGAPEPDKAFSSPYCDKRYGVKKSMREHAGVCEKNPNHKGPYFCHVEGCPSASHPFQKMKNLNHHMDWVHGWRECQE